MAKRCLHPRLKSHTFKDGSVMTMCPDCKYGEGHYDQSTNIEGKLYRLRVTPEAVELVEPDDSVLSTDESSEEEIAELQVGQTFVTIDAEVEVPDTQLDGDEEIGEEIEEEECVQSL